MSGIGLAATRPVRCRRDGELKPVRGPSNTHCPEQFRRVTGPKSINSLLYNSSADATINGTGALTRATGNAVSKVYLNSGTLEFCLDGAALADLGSHDQLKITDGVVLSNGTHLGATLDRAHAQLTPRSPHLAAGRTPTRPSRRVHQDAIPSPARSRGIL